MTYINIKNYKELYPKKDYTKLELNPIPKFLWRQLGLLKGGIIASMIQLGILIFALTMFGYEFSLVFLGAYLVILLIHYDNYNLIKQKLNPKKSNPSWRKYAIFIILLLGFIDMGLTFYYVDTYKTWQPETPFEDMELNLLLLFLWNTFGFELGMLVGILIILPIQYFLAKKTWIGIVILFGCVLLFAVYNHFLNINLLHDYMRLYS